MLYRRGDIWWADLRAYGLGRKSTGQKDKRKAASAAKRMAKGREVHHTLEDALIRAWNEHYHTLKSRRNIESQIVVLRPLVAGIKLADVDTPVISAIRGKLEARGMAAPTVNRYLALLSKVLKLANEWGWVEGMPYVPRRKEAKGRTRILTEAERVHLLTLGFEPGDVWMKSLVGFLLETGARLSEALGITEEDWKQARETGQWTIWESKGGRPRTVPLTRAGFAYLDLWGWRGKSARQCQDAWNRERKAMGLGQDTGFIIHCLRHSCASRLLDRGVDLSAIRDWLGHSTVAVTERYAHLNSGVLKDAARRLESVTPGAYDVPSRPRLQVVGGTDSREGFPSGQRDQTVNLTAQPSVKG